MANKKRMTKKEFMQVFNDAGFSFDVWGYEGILNMIAGYTTYLAENAKKNGSISISQNMKNQSKYIENYLEKIGYYENNL